MDGPGGPHSVVVWFGAPSGRPLEVHLHRPSGGAPVLALATPGGRVLALGTTTDATITVEAPLRPGEREQLERVLVAERAGAPPPP